MKKFKLVRSVNLSDPEAIKSGTMELESADFSTKVQIGEQMLMLQFELEKTGEGSDRFKLENKCYKMINSDPGIKLVEENFYQRKILETGGAGGEIIREVNLFFDNLHVYEETGTKPVKRGLLLHSIPGVGKTTAIASIAEKFCKNRNTTTIFWPSNSIHAESVEHFLKKEVDWTNIDHLILVIEDIGGVELDEGASFRSVDSDLLNFLDGATEVFTKPTMIIGTTNQPDAMLSSLTSRPGRFDNVIHLPTPNAEDRERFFRHFAGERFSSLTPDLIKWVVKKTEGFSVAHLKESYIRARLNDAHWNGDFYEKLCRSIDEISEWIKKQKDRKLAGKPEAAELGFFR